MSASARRSILYPSGPSDAPETDEHGRIDGPAHDMTGSTLVASPPARALSFSPTYAPVQRDDPEAKDRSFRQSLAGSTLGDEKRKSGLKRISAVGQKTAHRFLSSRPQVRVGVHHKVCGLPLGSAAR